MEYSPLSAAEAEIRLLTLAPEVAGLADDISCEITHESLMHPPSYVALSYHWGNLNDRRNITISESTISITSSLELALRYLRRTGRLLVWADALCINQADKDERSAQLLRMQAVYGQAEHVVAWLGPHENQSELVMKALQRRVRNLQARHYKYEEQDDAHLRALGLLFQRPYWERAWIIQELSVADRLQIMCSSDVVDLSDTDGLFDDLRYFGSPDELNSTDKLAASPGFQYIDRLSYIRHHIQNYKPIALMELLHQARDAKATDRKDKVFALINLSYDGRFLLPAPNYRAPPDQINFEISAAFMRKTRSCDLAVLMARPLYSTGCQPHRTWYPDWFCGSTWSEFRQVQYLKNPMSTFAECAKIDALSPKKRFRTVARERRGYSPQYASFVTNAFVIAEVEELSLSPRRPSETTPFPESPIPTRPKIDEASDDFVTQNSSAPIDYKNKVVRTVLSAFSLILGSPLRRNPIRPGVAIMPPKNLLKLHLFFAHSKLNVKDVTKLQGKQDPHWSCRSKYELLVQWATSNSHFRMRDDFTLLEALCQELPGSESVEYVGERTLERLQITLLEGRRLARTTGGALGWVPRWCIEGDELALLEGCTVPVVLRSRPAGGYWIVGESYFHGYMNEMTERPGVPPIVDWPATKLY